MFCKNCGNKLSDDDKFCSKCGFKSEINISTKQGVSNAQINRSSKIKVTKRESINAVLIIIISLVIVFMGFMMIVNLSEKNNKKTNNDYSQLVSAGLQTEEIDTCKEIINKCGFSNYSIEKDTSLDDLDGERNYWL